MVDISTALNNLIDAAFQYAPRIVLAIVVLLIGFWIINNLTKTLGKTLDKSGIDQGIQPFLKSLLSVLLKVLLIFSVAGIVGIETTSFVAMIAAAGFAIGIALQGSLGNFAAGVMILIFKPYKVGDLIQVEEEEGYVKEIQIFNTILTTFDNKTIIIPNGMAIDGKITNLSTRQYLRLNLEVTMPYDEDFAKVEDIILTALKNTPKVLEDPAPFVGIKAFDSHSIILAVRPYALTDDYWFVYFEANKAVKRALGENNIKVAYSEGVEMGRIGR